MTNSKKNRTEVERAAVEKALVDQNKKDFAKDQDQKGYTVFVSAHPESATFSIRAGGVEIRGIKDESKRGLVFRVPNDVVENFCRHEFVIGGRIVKAE